MLSEQDKVNGRKGMIHLLMNQNSGFLNIHSILYMGFLIFMCATIYFYYCTYNKLSSPTRKISGMNITVLKHS